MRFRLRTLLILSAIGPPMLAGVGLFFVPQIVWDGSFTLRVRYINDTGESIDRIESAVVWNPKDANLYVKFPDAERPLWKLVEVDDSGAALFTVKCSGRECAITGHEWGYRHAGAIVTRVNFADGSQSLFATTIPSERGVRELLVNISRGP